MGTILPPTRTVRVAGSQIQAHALTGPNAKFIAGNGYYSDGQDCVQLCDATVRIDAVWPPLHTLIALSIKVGGLFRLGLAAVETPLPEPHTAAVRAVAADYNGAPPAGGWAYVLRCRTPDEDPPNQPPVTLPAVPAGLSASFLQGVTTHLNAPLTSLPVASDHPYLFGGHDRIVGLCDASFRLDHHNR